MEQDSLFIDESIEKKHERISQFITGLIMIALFIIVFFAFKFDIERPMKMKGSIMVLGNNMEGFGQVSSTPAVAAATPTPAKPVEAKTAATNDVDAQSIKATEAVSTKKVEQPKETVRKPVEATPTPVQNNTPPKKEVDKSKLAGMGAFSGSSGNNSNGTGALGAPTGDLKGTASGTDGAGGDFGGGLSGRTWLTRPDFDCSNMRKGRFKFKIYVTSDGRITNIEDAPGSTITDIGLKNCAKQELRKNRISPSNGGGIQSGLVTVNFGLD